MAREASHVLRKEFLNSNVKLFTNKKQGLKPQLGDLVLILKEEPRLGLIVKISSPHRVVVKHRHHGTNKEIEYHSRILSLNYRPLVPSFFLSLANSTSMPSKHLSPQFWKKFKLQIFPSLMEDNQEKPNDENPSSM